MIGDQVKAPPEIPIIIIQIDIRATGEVRQNSTIMEEKDFLPALMLDAPEKLVELLIRKDCRKHIRDEKCRQV